MIAIKLHCETIELETKRKMPIIPNGLNWNNSNKCHIDNKQQQTQKEATQWPNKGNWNNQTQHILHWNGTNRKASSTVLKPRVCFFFVTHFIWFGCRWHELKLCFYFSVIVVIGGSITITSSGRREQHQRMELNEYTSDKQSKNNKQTIIKTLKSTAKCKHKTIWYLLC